MNIQATSTEGLFQKAKRGDKANTMGLGVPGELKKPTANHRCSSGGEVQARCGEATSTFGASREGDNSGLVWQV